MKRQHAERSYYTLMIQHAIGCVWSGYGRHHACQPIANVTVIHRPSFIVGAFYRALHKFPIPPPRASPVIKLEWRNNGREHNIVTHRHSLRIRMGLFIEMERERAVPVLCFICLRYVHDTTRRIHGRCDHAIFESNPNATLLGFVLN